MKKTGMIVAVEIEAVLEKYGEAEKQETIGNMQFMHYQMPSYELVMVHCGVGEIAAAAACQLLISLYGCEIIVNSGVVGGLPKEMTLSKTCIVEKVVHYDFDCSGIDKVRPGQYSGLPDEYIPTDKELLQKALEFMPGLKPVICASADKFVSGEKNKAYLHETYNADICEMDAAGIALVCLRNRVPCLMIKCVSDAITGGGEEFYREVLNSSAVCLEVTDKILRSLA